MEKWFALLKECGISGVMFEGYNENIYRLCKEAGLEAHYWKWTMNRRELLDKHPDWYAVNRKGESCHDKPATWIIIASCALITKVWQSIWQKTM